MTVTPRTARNSRMKKSENYFAEMVNEKDKNLVGIADNIRHVIKMVHQKCKMGKLQGEVYVLRHVVMSEFVKEVGIPTGMTANVLLFMQHSGITHKIRGVGKDPVWNVIKLKHLDEFLTPEMVSMACRDLDKRQRNNVNKNKALKKLKSVGKGVEDLPVDQEILETMAALNATIDQLEKDKDQLRIKYAQAEKELKAEREKADGKTARATVEAMIEKSRQTIAKAQGKK
jgi:outer membrane murein-binding lipoprotein Lpp